MIRKPKKGRARGKTYVKTREPKRRPGDSKKHLGWVRKLPCVCCYPFPYDLPDDAERAGEAHHLVDITPYGPQKGTALKNEDVWVIPLCPEHHRGRSGIHAVGSRNQDAFLAAFGYSVKAVDLALSFALSSECDKIRTYAKELKVKGEGPLLAA